jgi:hypothetical protein
MKLRAACVVVGFCSLLLSLVPLTVAQTTADTASALPRLVRFGATVKDLNGNPLTGVVGITFALYSEPTGGAALWLETQNVTADSNGHYTVLLGSTKPDGLPAELFTSEQARWVGVQVSGQAEQPRVLLVSAPYAFKAGDAETVGGLPPSAFVLANPAQPKTAGAAASSAATPKAAQSSAPPANPAVTGKGVAGYIPVWDTTSDIVDSVIFQKSAAIGIGTTAPAATLDVSGKADVRDTLTLVPKSTDNTLAVNGTTFKVSSTGKVTFITGQTFPGAGTITGVTTATGSGLSGGGTTGTLSLKVPSAGITNAMLANSKVTLNASAAGGLTVPGAMTLGDAYTIGLKTCSTGQVLQYSGTAWGCATIAGTGTITGVTAGADLTGGGTSGNVTLNLDTTKVPLLAAANTFTGNQTVNGNLSATGVVTGSSYQIGSNLFAYGSFVNQNAFLGFAGNTTTTGPFNTAAGYEALYANTTGGFNTADGTDALISNTTGGSNTATGAGALYHNTTGSNNTATGYNALASNNTGGPNDAFGYQALFSNTLGSGNVGLGYEALFSNVGDSSFDGWNNTAVGFFALYTNNDTSGIGGNAQYNVAVGRDALYSNTTGSENTASGASALYSNTTGYGNTADGASALGYNTTGNENTAVGFNSLESNSTGSDLTCVGYNTCSAAADGLSNATAIGAHARVGASNSLVLGGTGKWAVKVGIGTPTPSNVLTIAQGAGHPLSDGWDTFSSRRWKTNIETLPNALAKVQQLRGVSYDLKDSGKHEIGVIAEEVGAVVPELVSYEANGKDARGVDYSRLTALLIEATKEQQRQLREQQAELAKALRQIKQQQGLLRAQSSAMHSLEAEVREARRTLEKVKAQVAAQPALVAAK